MQDAYQLTSQDRVLQKTPYSFDVSVWEFFWPLMTGACLVMARPGGHKEPDYLVELIQREKITTLHFVPSMLQVFLESSGLESCISLRRVICSGEALPFEVQKRFFNRLTAELHNLYGPTEAAVDVTYWECRPECEESTVPIGRPIANTKIHILDRKLQPVPVGIPGELHIGGVGLARGYLNRPELTAEKFIPDPFGSAPNDRLYKTGDLARYRPDGNIEFLGRIDDQVKIHGIRIELGEIESVLHNHQAVREARVVVREDTPGARRLVAYVVPTEESAPSLSEIREYLKARLPSYMVPILFTLDKLPVTANGKLDRRALPPPESAGADIAEAFEPPRDPLEQLLVELWTEVLGLETVNVYDNFLDLGGDSLSAVQVVTRLHNRMGVRIRTNELAFQSLRQLAASCTERLQCQ
jgi:acyl-coenzyme A synthetase/AMP-(fatty) acid ligase/acyl carrier protein